MALQELANDLYNYDLLRSEGDLEKTEASLQKILRRIEEDGMAPLYASLAEKFSWTVDSNLLDRLKNKNREDLAAIEAKIEDATKNAGDTEVIEGYFSKAKYEAQIGDFAAAKATFDLLLAKPKIVTGKKIDAHMEKAKIALFNLNSADLKAAITEAKALNETGGDWDRRNRLKIYEALYLLHVRDVREAAKLLQDCTATFTCTEICSYQTFILYLVATSIITLDRNALRKQVIKDPHVITTIRELPIAQKVLHGIYDCNYKVFFEAMIELLPTLQSDRFTGPLTPFLLREYRVLAYKQFLEAYRSVHLSSMASAFGMEMSLLDKELSRFIAGGRLNAKIDKVGGIIETRRPDKKNIQYQEIIKKGDVLLNHIQKLVRAIDV